MNSSIPTRHILLASIAALLGAHSAHADLIWDSAATAANNWSTAAGNANWLPGPVVWTQNENAIFNATSGTPESIDVTTANIFNDMTFSVSGFSVTSAGAGSFLLANDLASTITVTNAADSASIAETIANNAGGASTLTKAGNGTLTLNGTAASTYSGGTIISAGTLAITQAGALGLGSVTNNATLNISVPNATVTGINSLSGAGIVNVTLGTGTNTTALNGIYSAFTGALNVGTGAAAGAGKVQLNGLDNAAATVNVLANGTTYVSATVTKNASIVLNGGDTGESLGQLRLEQNANWAGGVTLAGAITGAGDTFVGSNVGTGTISGVISETGGAKALSKIGAGTIVLSGMNSYSGGTVVLSGNLNVSVLNNTGSNGNVGTGSTISLGTAATGATLVYTGTGETTDRVIDFAGVTAGAAINQSGSGLLKFTSNFTATGAGAKTFTLTGSTNGTGEIAGAIVDNGGANTTAVTKSGTGTWTLSGVNPFTGGLQITAGTLAVGNDAALGAATVAVNLNGTTGTIRSADASLRTIANPITYSTDFTLGSATTGNLLFTGAVNMGAQNKIFNVLNSSTEFSGVISSTGTGIKTKNGSGTLVFSGANTFTGATVVNAGTLKLEYGANDNSKLADASTLTLGGGTVELSGGTHTELVSATTLLNNISNVTRSSGAAVLQLNTVTPAGNAVAFSANNIASTDNLNVNGILPWARFGSVWGMNATNTADGLIVAYTGAFADVTRQSGVVPNGLANNVRIVNGGAPGNVTLTASPDAINSLLVDASDGPATIATSGGTFMVGDEAGGTIWQTASSGGLTIGTAVNDGVLTTGNTANAGTPTLTILNDSTTNGVTVNSAINNNGSDVVRVIKGGLGNVTLAGTNGLTGAITVSAGTLILSGNNSARLTNASNLTNVTSGATLQLQANAGNTTAGVSSALSNEQTLNQPLIVSSGGTLQLRSDSPVTFAGGNNFGGLGAATITIDVNQLTGAGTNNAITFAPGNFNVSTTTINVTGGNGYSLNLNTITSTNSANGATTTLNPTTAPLTFASYTGTTAFTSTLNLSGTSAGNVVTGPITNTTNATVAVISLTKLGSSTWESAGVNTFTGTTTVREGTLTFSGNRTAAAGAITVGDTVGLNATFNLSNGAFSLGGDLRVANNVNTSIANQTGGAISFTAGNQVLVGAVAGTGTYNLSAGSITGLASTTRGLLIGINDNSTGTFNLSGTGLLAMSTSNLQIGRSDAAAVNATGTFNQTGGSATFSTMTIGGGAGAANYNANGTLNVTSGTFTATTFSSLSAADGSTSTINIGGDALVTLGAFPTARGVNSRATLTFDGGTLIPVAASTAYLGGLTNAFITNNGAKIDVVSGRAITISQALQNAPAQSGTLTKLGTSTLTLTGASSYSGGTTISAGVIQADNNSAVGAGPVIIAGGVRISVGSGITLANPITIGANTGAVGRGLIEASAGTATVTGAITINNAPAAGGHFASVGAAILNVNGVITASVPIGVRIGNVVFSGGGTGYTALSHNEGNVSIGANNGIATTAVLTAAVSAVTNFDLKGFDQELAGLLRTSGLASTVTSTAGTPTLKLNIPGANSYTFPGTISGSLALTKSGTGTEIVSGANSYTGGTKIDGGILRVSDATLGTNADTALGLSTTGVTIENGATLQVGHDLATTARTITLGTGGGQIDTNSRTVNLDAGSTVTGTTLTKIGNGTLRLAGTQTYATLNANVGTTNVKSALGTGTSTVNASAIVNFGTSQTLAALNINDGAVVTLDSTLAAPAFFVDEVAGSSVQAVPEPGSAVLLFGGMLTLLGLRRRK